MREISRLFEREWKFIFANRTVLMILLAVPVLYFTLFGFLYNEKRVTELPTVIVDQDQTELSRELVRAFDVHQTFAVTRVVATEDDAMEAVERGEAAASVVIPERTTERLKTGQSAEVLTVIDGSNMLISNTAVRAANTVIKSVSAGVTLSKLEAQGAWGDEGKTLFTGLDYRYRVLYNPTFSYLSFMVYGLGGTVLQQCLFLGVALSVAREKEEGTWSETLRQHRFGQLLVGKLAPYLVMATFNLVVTFAIVLKGFGVPYYGDLTHLLIVGTLFNVTVLSIGFAISFFSANQLQATEIAMLIAVPSFLLSGYTWPLRAMPEAVAAIGQSLPLTYFLHAVREVLEKGHGLSFITQDLAVLGLMTLIGLFAVYLLYHWQSSRKQSDAAERSQVA
ncbi:ABC transporter permease [Brevibacillus humidisoli]|uniref:ABC transporter permease n=1 Tax=Brevibacillus humidisoli TaxID=2895522 RepID=UPI001E5E227A|nr:ABC transporter permease [Brevibacillus humidisoli]UFJ40806.1 ABC transporter permease [Brevibacillus humidisoli]